MVAGCELWRRGRQDLTTGLSDGQNLDWARRKMGLPVTDTLNFDGLANSTDADSLTTPTELPSSDSVVKMRIDQSCNIRVLWEGRVKELLVSAGVGLGPLSKSSLSSTQASPTGSGGSGGLSSYGWTSVGVSVLYSS